MHLKTFRVGLKLYWKTKEFFKSITVKYSRFESHFVVKVITLFRHYVSRFSFGFSLIVFVFLLTATVATGIGLHCQTARAQLEASPPNLLPMSLTVVGLNGTKVVLNSTDIAGLPSVTGVGGYNSSVLGNYTGVPLTNLCDIVGGISNVSVVRITASDNYSQTFSFDQVVNGNFTTFDPITDNIVPHTKPLTLLIAYYKNGVNLTSDEGPLMVAIIGPEGLLTRGPYWVKFVTEIQVLSEVAVPEFQPFFLTLPLLITASTAVILFKKRATLHTR